MRFLAISAVILSSISNRLRKLPAVCAEIEFDCDSERH